MENKKNMNRNTLINTIRIANHEKNSFRNFNIPIKKE